MVNEDFSLPTFWMKHITAVLVLFTYIDYQFCSEHESFQQLKYQETVSLLHTDAGLPVFIFDFTFTLIIDVVILARSDLLHSQILTSQSVDLLGRTF